jgi:NADH-quinone oxidoreductase subunit N
MAFGQKLFAKSHQQKNKIMELSKFIIMRDELSLVVVLLLLLIFEVFSKKSNRHMMIGVAIGLFTMHTILGFLTPTFGSLFGDMYHNTATTSVMKNILNLGVLIVLLQSSAWLKQPENNNRVTEFFMLIFSTLIGMYYMISAGDFLMFYLGLELATIPIATLAAYEVHKLKSTEAGIKLLLLAAFSSGILLFGISMIYGSTGSVYYTDVAQMMNMNVLQIVALVFFISGVAFKISLVPFHLWTADTYEGAPTNVAAYLSVVSKGASVFVLIMLLFKVFPNMEEAWKVMMIIMAVITMTIGNLFALRQTNIQRFLAFSSVAQAGFILLGVIAGTQYGMTTVVYFILIYAFSNLAAFGVVSAVRNATGKMNITDYDGFYDTNPKLALVMILALFSLAGIPPVAGFFGKFFLFAAAAEQGYYIIVIIAVLNTIISLYYYLIVVKSMFINKTDTPIETINTDGFGKIGLVLSTVGMIVIGLWSYIFNWGDAVTWGM